MGRFWKSTFIFLQILLSWSPHISASQNDPVDNKGWLRICDLRNELPQHYQVEADECPHGSWISEAVEGTCICLNGVWGISHSWCDDDYYIAYGKGHCFNLDKQIRKLSFLGRGKDAFQPLNFITKERGHVFRTFEDKFLMPFEYSPGINNTIFRLKPKQDGILLEVQMEDFEQEADVDFPDGSFPGYEGPVCISNDQNPTQDDMIVYKFNKRIKSIKIVEVCPDDESPSPYILKFMKESMTSLKIAPGEAVHMKDGTVVKAGDTCRSKCKIEEGVPLSNSMGENDIFPLIRHKRQASKSKPKTGKGASAADEVLVDLPKSDGFESLTLDREYSDSDKDEMVNTENLRIIKQELNWLLDGIRPPTIDTPSYKLLQKIKEIFVKVCPKEEAPSFLLNAMLRLFRLLYLNSRDFFPHGHMIEEEDQYTRLNATLESCLTDAVEFSFTYADVKEEGKPCRKVSDEEEGNVTTYCPCKNELENLNVTYSMNMTGEPESFNLTNQSLSIPEELRFKLPSNLTGDNITYHDFPTETVWKMISFVHMYCAKYFAQKGGDHSALMTKMEDFFNEDIIYRWTKPGLLSDKIWEMLYSVHDMKKFAESVDVCLAGAKFVSEYPEWLNRPTLSLTRRKRRSLDSQKLWSGSAYCLEDPWDPINKLGVRTTDACSDFNKF